MMRTIGVTRVIDGIELDQEQMREWDLYIQAACEDEALAEAVWVLAHEARNGRWIPLGQLPSMRLDGSTVH